MVLNQIQQNLFGAGLSFLWQTCFFFFNSFSDAISAKITQYPEEEEKKNCDLFLFFFREQLA